MLTQVRRDGFAQENGEVTPGFSSVAAVVRGHTGHPAAAVAITYEPERAGPGEPDRLIAAVLRTASALERRLSGRLPG